LQILGHHKPQQRARDGVGIETQGFRLLHNGIEMFPRQVVRLHDVSKEKYPTNDAALNRQAV
jgi:hypothetical protein